MLDVPFYWVVNKITVLFYYFWYCIERFTFLCFFTYWFINSKFFYREYVQRAFCSIDTSEEKDQMERILKEKLEYVFRNNIKVDWKTENIPTIPSRAIASFRKSFNIRGNSVK